MLGNKLINTNAGGGCTNTVDLYNPFPDGGGLALYQLNGNATDVSGNYNGTATNVTYGAGQFGQAGVFNGNSNSYIFLSSLNSFFLNGGNAQNLSVSIWFKTVNTGILFSDFQGGFKSIIAINASGNITVDTRAVAGDFNYVTPETYNDDAWHHVVVTISTNSSNNKKVYIDNILKDTSTIPSADGQYASSGYGNNVSLATFAANGTTYGGHNCSIDQVRIFNRALRPYEVEALYTEEYCTPTIVPSEHFNTVLYTAATTNGTYDITGSSFQPDLIWVKNRDNVENHFLFDSVRGMTNMTDKFISSNRTVTEATASAAINGTTVTAIDGGFRVVETSINSGELYFNGRTYVSWNFKAGGAAVTNNFGSIESQVSANTEAGFSIVSYTGNNIAGATIGHGLGVEPDVIIVKNRDTTDIWTVQHSALTYSDYIDLSSTNAATTNTAVWYAQPTSEVFSFGANPRGNGSGNKHIAYCFAEVEGFSNFGSYVGTGTTSGPTVVTGFEPAFVMVKRTDASGNSWLMVDNKRVAAGNEKHELFANTSTAESGTGYDVAFLENGFQMQTTTSNANASGASYIYMAFAADPTAVEPTLEDSFNTVVYSGNGSSSQAITGVGFQPDMVWQKHRRVAYQHNLMDSVRGANTVIFPDNTELEDTSTTQWLLSFDNDGFTTGANVSINGTSGGANNMVTWCWKGAEIPAINSNGSIPSVVSANPAAGFSIVSWTSSGSNTSLKTVGHGLGNTPNVVILKNRSAASTSWRVYHSGIPSPNNSLALNSAEAAFAFFPSVSSTNFGLANSITTGESSGASGQNIIAYCFAEVAGFSKFGSYSGNSSTQSINVGFEPAMIILRAYNTTYDWVILDNKRGTDNRLFPNLADAESPLTNRLTFTATGFNLLTASYNSTGQEFIYMAFANQF